MREHENATEDDACDRLWKIYWFGGLWIARRDSHCRLGMYSVFSGVNLGRIGVGLNGRTLEDEKRGLDLRLLFVSELSRQELALLF